MKRKMIEKAPFNLTGQKTTKKHIHVVDAQLVDKYICFDFYSNIDNKWRPDFRTVIGPKEFENYVVSDEIWNSKQINYLIGEDRYYTNYTQYQKTKKLIDVPDKVRTLAEEYFTKNDLHSSYYANDLISQMEQVEFHIKWEYRATAAERRYRRVQEKMAELEGLPKDFNKFLKEKAYKNDHIMFFSDKKAFCSRCGRELPPGEYKHNERCKCPKCHKSLVAKSYKRYKALPKYDNKEILIMQTHNEEIVLRYIKTCLIQDGESKEQIEFTESVRTYHDPLLRYKSRYIHYFDNMVGGDYWEDKMSPYHQVAYGRSSILYTNNLEELKIIVNREWLEPMRYWADEGISMPLKDYLQSGKIRAEFIERLMKSKLYKLATDLAKNTYGFLVDWDKTELKKALGISKSLFNWAQESNATGNEMRILQDATETNYGLSDEEIIEIAKSKIMPRELKEVCVGNKLIKTLHYLQKAAGYKNIKERFEHYRDYLGLAKQLQYDLDNDTVRYPKDVKAAHDKASSEFNIAEMDEKIKKAILKYPGISYVRENLEKDFGYKDKKYEIVAPENAGDIIEEGRILHHCVGGDGYLSKHNTGKSFILFLRKMSEPDERYYTIEIDPATLRILQYYGAYDKKPDKEQIDKFLNKWKQYLYKKHYKEKETA